MSEDGGGQRLNGFMRIRLHAIRTQLLRIALCHGHEVAHAAGLLVGGTDDALAGNYLLETMRSPSRHAGAGEQRRQHLIRNAQRAIDAAAVQIHVRADVLALALRGKQLRGHILDDLQQAKIGHTSSG